MGTVSNQPFGHEASVAGHDGTSLEVDIIGTTKASLGKSPQPGLTVAFGNAGTTSQNSAGKAETSSKPDGEDTVESPKPTTQVAGDSGASVAGSGEATDVDTISTHGFDPTILPNLSNAGTEAGNPSTSTSHAAESSTSDLEEAVVVINLKTVGSNILSSTINVEEGVNDLTTRQLDLQDLTTKTTEYVTSTTDILTQDLTQTNEFDKETLRIETTTDNSLSEGQAPELDPSLPSSQTNVNTNSNNLGGTKHPLSTH